MRRLALMAAVLAVLTGSGSLGIGGELEEGFREPPAACSPPKGWWAAPGFAAALEACPPEVRPAFDRALAHGAVSITPEEAKRMAAWAALAQPQALRPAEAPPRPPTQPWDALREPLDAFAARLVHLCSKSEPVGGVFTQEKPAHGVTIYPPTPGLYLARRKAGEADLYLAVSQRRIDTVCTITFPQVEAPELWDPADGSLREAPCYVVQDKSTALNLRLGPYGVVAIVLRRPPSPRHVAFASALRLTVVEEDGRTVRGLAPGNGRCSVMFADGSMSTADVRALPQPLEVAEGWSLKPRGPAERSGVGIAQMRWHTANLEDEKPAQWAAPDFDHSAWRRHGVGGPDEPAPVGGPRWQAWWLTWEGDRQSRCFRKAFPLAEKSDLATVTLTADNGYELFVNGQRIGADGNWNEAETYDIREALRVGPNVLAVRNTNAGGVAGLLLEARIRLASGKFLRIVSDKTWKVAREAPEGWSQPGFDAAAWDPPHVEGQPPIAPWGEVKGLPEDPVGGQVTWLRFTLPAGARTVHLPEGLREPTLFVDGQKVPLADGVADLAGDVQKRPRLAALRALGAVTIARPILCQCAEGAAGLGNWLLVGYPTHSGLADYTVQVTLPRAYSRERLVLDLGQVACAARVQLNGQDLDTRLWPPYSVDVTEAARPGANTLQVTVANTAANGASAGGRDFPIERLAAGLLGPVRIRPLRPIMLQAK